MIPKISFSIFVFKMRVCPKVFIYYRPISLYSLLIITVVSILAGYNHVSNLWLIDSPVTRQQVYIQPYNFLLLLLGLPSGFPFDGFQAGGDFLYRIIGSKACHLIGEQIRTVKEQRYRLLLFRETYSRKSSVKRLRASSMFSLRCSLLPILIV